MTHTTDAALEDSSRSNCAISLKDDEVPPRILIVDDQEINRVVVVRILQSMGYGTAVAENGKEAVDKWEHGGFDLILMDIHMPLIDGIEATWIIRCHEKERGDYTPIIACSAGYAQECPEEFSRLGFDGFVRKPLVFETLLWEIKRSLQLKRVGPAFLDITGQVSDPVLMHHTMIFHTNET